MLTLTADNKRDCAKQVQKRPSVGRILSELGGIGAEDLRSRALVSGHDRRNDHRDPDPSVAIWADTLRRDGCVVIPSHVAADVCEQWDSAIRELLLSLDLGDKASSELERVAERVLNGGSRLRIRKSQSARGEYDAGFIDCFEPQLSIPLLRAFRDDPVIHQIIEHCVGGPVSLRDCHFYRTRGLAHPRGWHMDVWQRSSFKAFVYLTDVPSLDFGPYSYIPGSHRPSLSRYLAFVLNSLQGVPPGDILSRQSSRPGRPFLGSKGTLIITNQRGYHRGHAQQPGRERVLLVNHYAARSEHAQEVEDDA